MASGIANVRPRTSARSALMIASVIGSVIVIFVPMPSLALDVDDAAELLDVGLDDVHADAAPGELARRPRAW